MPHRIVLTTFGSLGDLHPYLALAEELKRRGHQPVIATLQLYQPKIESAGIEFRLLRTASVERPDPELIHQILDLRHGPEFMIRKLLMPSLETAYQDTLAAIDGASLLISHPMTFVTRVAAELKNLPWVSTQLAPMGFFSAYDPPVLPLAPIFPKHMRALGPQFFGPFLGLCKYTLRSWTEPYHKMRAKLNLPLTGDPVFEGSHSPFLMLSLFSSLLGAKQPDWPSNSVVTGFPFYDRDESYAKNPENPENHENRDNHANGLDQDLQKFLDAGPAPIVFTLGTSAVADPGRFYQDSIKAAQLLKMRAILLIGKDGTNHITNLPDGIAAFDYAPFSELFPRAAVVVHQGGVGTTAQAMRAGRPMLVMPYAFDQPDNAERARRLGIARIINRGRYSPERAAAELKIMLDNADCKVRAAKVGEQIASENGAAKACDEVEKLLGSTMRG